MTISAPYWPIKLESFFTPDNEIYCANTVFYMKARKSYGRKYRRCIINLKNKNSLINQSSTQFEEMIYISSISVKNI